MKPEAQRIAIAKACGIEMPEHWKGDARNEASFLFRICPDYLNDLNAMHDAEKILSAPQWDDYIFELNELISRSHCARYAVCATASQRAQAFLRALDIWAFE